MKRILLLFSALMLSCIALWAHDVEIGGIYYNLNETQKTAGVTYRGNSSTDYREYSGSVTIPETITYNSEIYSINYIVDYAFYNCSGLAEVTIPNSVTHIGYGAFKDCSGLTSVTIGESVTSIFSGAFWGCSGLTSVTIPNSVTSIGYGAFEDCSGLTSVSIGESVTSIGQYAFFNTGIYNSESNWDNGVLYIDNCLIQAKSDVVKGSYTIKKGTRIISDEAFRNCSGLTEVTIPNSVMYIDAYAFSDCSGLTSVTIGESVTSIGSSAFSGCSGLTEVTIPHSITSIDYYAFRNCSGLTSVTIPNSVTYIGAGVFSGCSGLTSVTIPNSVTSIGSEAFENCSGLTEVTIGESVTSIGDEAFSGCNGLTSVTIPNSVTSIGSEAFENCSGLTEVTIGESVTSIGDKAFSGCSGLTEVTIPNSVTSIDSNAFYNTGFYNSESNWDNGVLYINNCLITAKSDVVKGSYTIKEGTRVIGNEAFEYCSGLTEVTIPNSVTYIGSRAFIYCDKLTSVTIPNSVTSIGTGAFYNTGFYNSESNWDNGVLYINNRLITAKSDVVKGSYTIKEGTRFIGDRAFKDCSGLTSITIPNSVTSIGSEAFGNCSGLTSVTIGNNVTSIGSSAFKGCSGLTEVTIGESVTSIGSYAFYYTGFYNSESNWDNGVLYIDNCLIEAKSDVVKGSYTIKEGTRVIGLRAFDGCSGLTEITIPNSVTFIGYDAFNGCSSLTSVIWNAKNCEDFKYDSHYGTSTSPFYNIRSNITSFTFGNEVEHIPAYLCYDMEKLKEVTIGESVTSIDEDAFSGCDKLRKVTAYPTTVPNAYESSFAHYNAALYVPCDVYDDYFFDDVFGTFKVTECIAAEEDEPTSITETLADANITVSGGTISADADFSIYNTIGQDVTAFNGSLQPGIYLVSIENNIVKVMVH